jgi:hypothetical protein
MASLLGISAGDWSAIAAWCAVVLGVAAGVIARRQLRLAQRVREEQAQPYVVVYIEPNPANAYVVELVIRNFGATAAKDVRVSFDAPLISVARNGEHVEVPKMIPVLVPGQEWRTLWDTGAHVQAGLTTPITATVRFRDSHERELPPYEYMLDWEHLRGREPMTIYGAHDAAKALAEISKAIRKWSEGTSGLSVFTRDGDARDARRMAAYEERQAEAAHKAEAARQSDAETDGAPAVPTEPPTE